MQQHCSRFCVLLSLLRRFRFSMCRHDLTSLCLHPPAKLNVSLRILGRRDDGFHELESEFVTISCRDTLQIRPSAVDRLSVTGRFSDGVPSDRRNLVWTVIDRWRERVGSQQQFAIALHKRIPNEAGLGGGSSDAASALWAVNRLAGSPLAADELGAIAASAGSDLNFFLSGGPRAICRGRGERVEPIEPRSRFVVVARPAFGLPTGAVFARWTELRDQVASGSSGTREVTNVANDLQSAAESLSTELYTWRLTLEARTRTRWQMTGSGSTYFAYQENQRAAGNTTRKLRAAGYSYSAAVRTDVGISAVMNADSSDLGTGNTRDCSLS